MSHARGGSGSGGPGEGLGLWSSVQRGDLALSPNGRGTKFRGESTTYRVGLEKSFDNRVAGLTVSYFDGDLDFNDATNDATGTMELDQLSVHSYLAVDVGSARLWGTLGMGDGSLDYSDNRTFGQSGSSDVKATMAAIGVEFDMARLDLLEFTGRIEGMASQLDTEEDSGQGRLYRSASLLARGLRGEVEMGMPVEIDGGTWRPYLTAGYRLDSGNGGGEALEYGAGFLVQTSNFNLDASARSQDLHNSGDFERDSYSVSFSYDGGNDGMGWSLGLRTGQGNVAGQNPFAKKVSFVGDSSPQRQTTSLETSYGIDLGHVLLKPYANTEFSDGVATGFVTGLNLKKNGGQLGFDLDLTHTVRLAPVPSQDDQHALEVKANISF